MQLHMAVDRALTSAEGDGASVRASGRDKSEFLPNIAPFDYLELSWEELQRSLGGNRGAFLPPSPRGSFSRRWGDTSARVTGNLHPKHSTIFCLPGYGGHIPAADVRCPLLARLRPPFRVTFPRHGSNRDRFGADSRHVDGGSRR
jgi:hypothetical protein